MPWFSCLLRLLTNTFSFPSFSLSCYKTLCCTKAGIFRCLVTCGLEKQQQRYPAPTFQTYTYPSYLLILVDRRRCVIRPHFYLLYKCRNCLLLHHMRPGATAAVSSTGMRDLYLFHLLLLVFQWALCSTPPFQFLKQGLQSSSKKYIQD